MKLHGQTALVTGGSRGIGMMIARGLLQAGARVYITARKAEACDAAAAELSQFGECISVPSDLSTRAGAEHLYEGVAAREKKVHILVNNAGAAWGAPIDEYPEDGWDKVLDTNVKGVFFTTQLFLPLLRAAATAQDRASVVNIGSVDGLSVPVPESFAYSASKAAVHMLTRHLARRLVDENINVNAIAPGLFPSKMTSFMYATPEAAKATLELIPMHREGGQDDVAGAVIYLSSRAGAYVTGAVIPVSGGLATLS
ncbi:MAG TPA: SDR family NAD(P)-dependent oxidoreductase [Candidatus Dormibacteraeota bacterium]|nr:SDR family NAD(P)-dependent oxidoreductase [Candidatus Dormibacteraeota bacterium]